MADCHAELREKLGLKADEAKEILDAIRNYSGDARDKLLYAQAKAEGLTREAALREFRAKQGAVTLADARAHVSRFGNIYQGVKSYLVGSDKPVPEARLSVHASKLEAWKDIEGHLEKDLRAIEPRFAAWVNDGEFNREVAKAMWSLRDPAGIPYKAPATAWGPKVLPIAQTLDKYKEGLRQRLNDLGADIHQAGQHVMPQTHDGFKLAKAGKEGWVDFIAPLLDEQRTFRGSDMRTVLGKVYDKIVDGHWGAYTDERLAQGKGNLADSLGESRELHFRGAEEWMQYNERFGLHSGIVRGVVADLQHKTEAAALIERMTTDPGAFYRKLRAQTKVQGYDVELVDSMFKAVTGQDRIPGSARMARYASGFRSWLTMSHLGLSLTSQFPDLVSIGARARFNGIGYLDSHANQMRHLLTGRTKGELRDLADSLGVFADGALAHAYDRLSATDLPTGTMSKLANRFMTWNGMRYWDDVQREGAGLMLAHNLGRQIERGVAFDALDDELRKALPRYGIGAAEWGKLGAAHITEVEGRRFLDVDKAPAALGRRLRTYLTQEAELSLPIPSAFERAVFIGGTQPGTVSGELRRFLLQYKMSSLTMLTRVLPQVYQMGVPHLGVLVLGTTALGYVSLAARELASGRTPPDTTDHKTWAAAIVRGGAAGVLGDLFLDSARDMRKGLSDVALGPAFSLGADAFRVYQHAANLKEDTLAQAFRVGINNTPFVNLLYLKTAINYLFSWHVQEMLNPGYLNRTERRIKRERKSEYFVPPSSVIAPGGGFR